MLNNLLKKYTQFRPFTESEAWGLFRIAAIAEACGWTLLIIGIWFGQFIIPGNNLAVQIAGQVHGMIFLTYIAAVFVLSPSQNWSTKRTIIAGLASVPPYGSLIFEQWAAHKRRRLHLHQSVSVALYSNLLNGAASSSAN